MSGGNPRPPGADLRGRRAPLRAGGDRRPGAGDRDGVPGNAERHRLLAGAGWPGAAQRASDPGSRPAAAARLRFLPDRRAARPASPPLVPRPARSGPHRAGQRQAGQQCAGPHRAGPQPWHGRAGGLGPGPRRAARGMLARHPAADRRPGLRRRHRARHPAVHRRPPRPVGPARLPGRGLRRVLRPVPGGLDRALGALAALGHPDRDDLRRPRRARRLEHLRVLAPRLPGQAVVARADQRGLPDLLDLPAPGQPVPGRPGQGRAMAPGDRRPGRRGRPAPRLRQAGRPAVRRRPVELRALLRPGTSGHDRLAGPAGCWTTGRGG